MAKQFHNFRLLWNNPSAPGILTGWTHHTVRIAFGCNKQCVIVPILTELNSNCPIIRYLKYVKVMQCIKKLRILCGYGVMRICIIQHHFSIAIVDCI